MTNQNTDTTPADDSANKSDTKPLSRCHHGAVSAAVFCKELSTKQGELFTKYSVGIDRSYKDAAGEWHNSATLWLQEADLYRAALCLLESLDDIRKRKREATSDE